MWNAYPSEQNQRGPGFLLLSGCCCNIVAVFLVPEDFTFLWVVISSLNPVFSLVDHCAWNDVTISEKTFYNGLFTPCLLIACMYFIFLIFT